MAVAALGCGGGEKTVTVTRTATPPPATTARTTATTPSVGLSGALTPHGMGGVRIGMTQTEVERAVGGELKFRGDFCAAPAGGPEGVFVEFDQSPVVDAVGAENRVPVSTDRGLAIGDPVSRARAIYGSELRQMTPNPDAVGQGTDFVIRPASGPDRAFQIDVWSAQGRITGLYAVRAGDRRDEFCA